MLMFKEGTYYFICVTLIAYCKSVDLLGGHLLSFGQFLSKANNSSFEIYKTQTFVQTFFICQNNF